MKILTWIGVGIVLLVGWLIVLSQMIVEIASGLPLAFQGTDRRDANARL
jgi:hypothetical protein